MPVWLPPMPTNGDTNPAENMPANPKIAEALPALCPYFAIAIENPVDPNTDTVQTVKNRITLVIIKDQLKYIAQRNRIEPIVNCNRLVCKMVFIFTTLLTLALITLARIIPQLLIPNI